MLLLSGLALSLLVCQAMCISGTVDCGETRLTSLARVNVAVDDVR